MARYAYTVMLIPERDDYVVHVPALPGCITQGGSIEEALAMAAEAIGLWLHGDPPRQQPDGIQALTATVTLEVDVVDGVVRTPGVVDSQASLAVGD